MTEADLPNPDLPHPDPDVQGDPAVQDLDAADAARDGGPGVQQTLDVDVVDLDSIDRSLDDVESALARLADDTYWVDEVTGEPLPEHVLAADPTARRA